ncbi:MAG: class I SAM-dependent methyltransferase [Vulcanimicrobiaceae bacterium]
MDYPRSDYLEHPKTLAPDDFWGQVKRTVAGKPIAEEQIVMIVEAVKKTLALTSRDILLDLACGNGALSARLFDSCAGALGVDVSEYLIEIAKQYFSRPPQYDFLYQDVASYVLSETEPQRFSKVLCYASFQYFSPDDARELLSTLANRFPNIELFYIGNLPDRDRHQNFFRDREVQPGELDDHTSQIGIWRTEAEFARLAASTGWSVTFSRMPDTYFTADNRYDALLMPNRSKP